MTHRIAGTARGPLAALLLAACCYAVGALASPTPLEALGACGTECKGLKCKVDPAYPTTRCAEEVPGEVCTNFACDPTPF